MLHAYERNPEAVISYRNALLLAPEHRQARYLLADALQRQQRYEEARDELETVNRAQPTANSHLALAHILDQLGEESEAENELELSLEFEPTALAHFRMAEMKSRRHGDG